jgi:transcriptional regulator
MSQAQPELLQGTLDLLILKTLAVESLHGWGIAKRIQHASRDILRINQGSLYPALYRLRDRGLIGARWGTSAEGRRVKIYELTADGQGRLEEETANWAMVSAAVNHVLSGA